MATMMKDHGQYFAIYRDPIPDPVTGKRKQRWDPLGKNIRVARVRMNEIEKLLEQGKSPRRQNITFGEAWRRRMLVGSFSNTTRPKMESLYARHLEDYFGSRPVRTLNSKEVVSEFTIHCRECGMKDGTLTIALSTLRAMLNWCYASEYLETKPRPDWFEFPVKGSRKLRPLTFDQVERLAAAVDEHYSVFILWSAYVGTRLGESRAIDWDDFNDDMSEVWIRRAWQNGVLVAFTKTEDVRHTPVIPRLRKELLALKERQGGPTHGLVFTDKSGNAMDADIFRQRYFNPAKQRAGLSAYTIHDLRHTCCSLMHKQGQATAREIMQWLGWSELTTLLRYLHSFDEKHAVCDKMQENWDRVVLSAPPTPSEPSDETLNPPRNQNTAA